LLASLGSQYRDYQRTVPMLVPFAKSTPAARPSAATPAKLP